MSVSLLGGTDIDFFLRIVREIRHVHSAFFDGMKYQNKCVYK
jgi:hypothetical protein